MSIAGTKSSTGMLIGADGSQVVQELTVEAKNKISKHEGVATRVIKPHY